MLCYLMLRGACPLPCDAHKRAPPHCPHTYPTHTRLDVVLGLVLVERVGESIVHNLRGNDVCGKGIVRNGWVRAERAARRLNMSCDVMLCEGEAASRRRARAACARRSSDASTSSSRRTRGRRVNSRARARETDRERPFSPSFLSRLQRNSRALSPPSRARALPLSAARERSRARAPQPGWAVLAFDELRLYDARGAREPHALVPLAHAVDVGFRRARGPDDHSWITLRVDTGAECVAAGFRARARAVSSRRAPSLAV